MLLTILFLLALLATMTGTLAGVLYPFRCQALENHLSTKAPDIREDQEGRYAWNKKRWALDKIRTRVALWALGSYAVGMFTLIPVGTMIKAQGVNTHAPMIMIILLSLSMVVVGLRSVFHNEREFNSDLKRRYPLS